MLTDISPKSPLSFLLSPGDIIVEIQGKVIGNTNDLIRAAKDISSSSKKTLLIRFLNKKKPTKLWYS